MFLRLVLPNLSDYFLKILYTFAAATLIWWTISSSYITCVDFSLLFLVLCSYIAAFPFWDIIVVSEHNIGSACGSQPLCYQENKKKKKEIRMMERMSFTHLFSDLIRASPKRSSKEEWREVMKLCPFLLILIFLKNVFYVNVLLSFPIWKYYSDIGA